MAALAKNKPTPEKSVGPVQQDFSIPVAASTNLYAGGLACTNASGLAVPGATSTTLLAWGVAVAQADNSAGIASAINVQVRAGTWLFANSSAGDLIAQADVGKKCYIVDDQTVAKTDGTGTRSIAGKIVGVSSEGVLVQVGPAFNGQ